MTPPLRQRLARAVPAALLLAPLHGLAVAGLVALRYAQDEVAFGHRALLVLAIFFAGSALGGAVALVVGHAFAAGRPASARLAAMLVLLAVGTAGGSALLYYFVYRAQFQAFTRIDLNTLFVGASAGFTFIASGLTKLLPLGLVLLLAEGALYARWSALRPAATDGTPPRQPEMPRAEPP